MWQCFSNFFENADVKLAGESSWLVYRSAYMPHKLQPISNAIRAKLEAARVARLATLDAEYGPHIVPVCFVYDGKVFYSAVDRKPKRVAPERLARLRHLTVSPQIALIIDEYHEDWARLWYILVRGKAIRQLRAKYLQYAAAMLPDDAPVIRITPERITSWGRI
jgi:PPOX class probable F420-dependent enzyme